MPVGEDQIPHIELTREIVRRFNNLYQPVFPEPQVLLSQAALLPGIDGRKMSKSYGNEIPYAAPPDELRARVKLMVTDPQRVRKTDPGDPEVCTVYTFQKIFNKEATAEINSQCRQAGIGCVECKKRLADQMVNSLADIHTRRAELEANPRRFRKSSCTALNGPAKLLQTTMQEVRSAMNL